MNKDITVLVMVNGRTTGRIKLPEGLTTEGIEKLVLVPNKVLNILTTGEKNE